MTTSKEKRLAQSKKAKSAATKMLKRYEGKSREARLAVLANVTAALFGMGHRVGNPGKKDYTNARNHFNKHLIWLGLTKEDVPEAKALADVIIKERSTKFLSGETTKPV